MKEDEILSGLEKLVRELGIALRYEKGDFAGGFCVLNEDPMIIIQRKLETEQKIKILARELAQSDLEHKFVVPALRVVIEEARADLNKVEEVENASNNQTEQGA